MLLIGCDLAVISSRHFAKPRLLLQQERLPRQRLLFLQQQQQPQQRHGVRRTANNNNINSKGSVYGIANDPCYTIAKSRNNFKKKKPTELFSTRLLDNNTSTSKLFASHYDDNSHDLCHVNGVILNGGTFQRQQQQQSCSSKPPYVSALRFTSNNNNNCNSNNNSNNLTNRDVTTNHCLTIDVRKVWQKRRDFHLKDYHQQQQPYRRERIVFANNTTNNNRNNNNRFDRATVPLSIRLWPRQESLRRQLKGAELLDKAQGAATPMSASRLAPRV